MTVVLSLLNLGFLITLLKMHFQKDKTGLYRWYTPFDMDKNVKSLVNSQEQVSVILTAISDNLLNQFNLIKEMEKRIENRVVEKTSKPPQVVYGKKKNEFR